MTTWPRRICQAFDDHHRQSRLPGASGLVTNNNRLLKFVEDGGTLLVFYHRTNEWNPDERRNRPVTARIRSVASDDRVTEEDAPVTVSCSTTSAAELPQQDHAKGFSGWIQERGLYFPKVGRYAAV